MQICANTILHHCSEITAEYVEYVEDSSCITTFLFCQIIRLQLPLWNYQALGEKSIVGDMVQTKARAKILQNLVVPFWTWEKHYFGSLTGRGDFIPLWGRYRCNFHWAVEEYRKVENKTSTLSKFPTVDYTFIAWPSAAAIDSWPPQATKPNHCPQSISRYFPPTQKGWLFCPMVLVTNREGSKVSKVYIVVQGW